MTVKDILGAAVEKTGRTNFVNSASYTADQQNLVNKLLAALNSAYREITAEYLPLLFDEEITLTDGTYAPASLTKTILYPVRLTDKAGVRHVLKNDPAVIRSDFSGEATLTYAYSPAALTLNDSVSDMRLNVGVLSDGLLAEYYFSGKSFDLAEEYDTRFRAAASLLRYKGRDVTVKARRWGV